VVLIGDVRADGADSAGNAAGGEDLLHPGEREGEVFGPLPRIEVDPVEDRLGGVDDDVLARRGELTDMRESRLVRTPLRFRVRFGPRSDRNAFRTALRRSDATIGQCGG